MDKHDITLHEIIQMPLGERITGIISYRDEVFITTEQKVFRLDKVSLMDYKISAVGLTNPSED